jgi:hypothetical protein
MTDLNVKLNELEDVKFLHLIIKELLNQVDQNIEVFSCEKNVSTEDFINPSDPDVEPWHAKSTTLDITWRPSNDTNHPYKHIDKIRIKWQPQYGTMKMEFRAQTGGAQSLNGRDSYNITYTVGYDHQFFNEYMQVKKDFCTIFKKIAHWRLIEIPRRDREKLINAVCQAFPGILDTLLAGDRSEKT